MIAILGLAVAGVPFLTAAGVATSLVVLVMVTAAITLLPAFLGLAGPRVNGIRSSRRREIDPTISPRWRPGAGISRHAWGYAVGVTALLIALTAPVLALELGFPDNGNLGEERTERQAFDLTTEAFGAGFTGPLMIALDPATTDAGRRSRRGRPGRRERRVRATGAAHRRHRHHRSLRVPRHLAAVAWDYDTVQRIRADVFPPVSRVRSLRPYRRADRFVRRRRNQVSSRLPGSSPR